jgi:hypothetical protein
MSSNPQSLLFPQTSRQPLSDYNVGQTKWSGASSKQAVTSTNKKPTKKLQPNDVKKANVRTRESLNYHRAKVGNQ